jgi:hypothetical protein
MTPLHDYLKQCAQPVPSWLMAFRQGDPFPRADFFAANAYYPGHGDDGHAVKVFGSAHIVHCFVYADKGMSRAEVQRSLGDRGFLGYHTLHQQDLREEDLTPNGWRPHIPPGEFDPERMLPESRFMPYGLFVVLQRDDDKDDSHGPERLAILFLGADGHATYDALFCQAGGNAPLAVLIQDHGFGGDYSSFGRGGIMERIATSTARLPRFLLVAEGTDPWVGYSRIPGVAPDCGGMYATPRYLYERKPRK